MRTGTRRQNRPLVTIILALVILVPAMWGFGTKFVEFLALVGDEQGAFAIVPILNYLLVSCGFLLLFGWAILQGMFRDIERPKYSMLANEQRLDEELAEETAAWEGDDFHYGR